MPTEILCIQLIIYWSNSEAIQKMKSLFVPNFQFEMDEYLLLSPCCYFDILFEVQENYAKHYPRQRFWDESQAFDLYFIVLPKREWGEKRPIQIWHFKQATIWFNVLFAYIPIFNFIFNLSIANISIPQVTEVKENMTLGSTLVTNPKGGFLVSKYLLRKIKNNMPYLL